MHVCGATIYTKSILEVFWKLEGGKTNAPLSRKRIGEIYNRALARRLNNTVTALPVHHLANLIASLAYAITEPRGIGENGDGGGEN